MKYGDKMQLIFVYLADKREEALETKGNRNEGTRITRLETRYAVPITFINRQKSFPKSAKLNTHTQSITDARFELYWHHDK
jgi:hypothetical protein